MKPRCAWLKDIVPPVSPTCVLSSAPVVPWPRSLCGPGLLSLDGPRTRVRGWGVSAGRWPAPARPRAAISIGGSETRRRREQAALAWAAPAPSLQGGDGQCPRSKGASRTGLLCALCVIVVQLGSVTHPSLSTSHHRLAQSRLPKSEMRVY